MIPTNNKQVKVKIKKKACKSACAINLLLLKKRFPKLGYKSSVSFNEKNLIPCLRFLYFLPPPPLWFPPLTF